ncbi:MAG: BatD family protein [Gammaproteobacteria bacterium]|jgi:ribosome-binding factor A
MNLKFLTLFFLLLFSSFIRAEISVSVDRNPVVADESFQLIFESDEKVKVQPDFSPLNKNFTILNTGRRSNTQIINGDFKQSQQWILKVIAKKTGIVQIPSIKFGDVSSQPYQVKVVTTAPPSVGNKSEDIFIEAEVNKKSSYVQEQIIYTVKLYRAVQTSNATLSEPKISGDQAVITKLGEDKSFETRIKAKRYVVVQRQYAIFPQSSGSLRIEPIIFQGQTGASSFFGFDPFGPQPKSIVKRSNSIELDIQAIPDSFTGDTWLPASQINIQEQWSVDPSQLKQGEATTRTVTITVNGLASSHLPAIESILPDSLKQYPDQPEFNETFNENGFVGVRSEKMAIIPTQSGEFVLPAIQLPWWNTKTDKMEVAELPERTIYVDASTAVQAEDNQQIESTNKSNAVSNEDVQTEKQTITDAGMVDGHSYWKWVSLILFLLWLITLFLLWKSRNRFNKEEKISNAESSKRQALKQIENACNNNDAQQAKTAILEWARKMWPDKKINNLDAVKVYCDDELATMLDELNRQLYSKEQDVWNGKVFLNCFQSQSFKKTKSKAEQGKLEPLYK